MPDIDTRAIFLATLETIAKNSPTRDTFSSAEINDIAGHLGLTPAETLQLIRQLNTDGRVKAEWGGDVRLIPQRESKSIHLGEGAVFVGEGANVGPGTAIGANAMAAGATRTAPADQAQAITALTAALAILTQSIAATPTQAHPELTQLVQQTQAMLPELRSANPDKDTLKEKLEDADKTLDVISKAGTMLTAAAPHLGPALGMLHSGFSFFLHLFGG
jgi:hypothetical protein